MKAKHRDRRFRWRFFVRFGDYEMHSRAKFQVPFLHETTPSRRRRERERERERERARSSCDRELRHRGLTTVHSRRDVIACHYRLPAKGKARNANWRSKNGVLGSARARIVNAKRVIALGREARAECQGVPSSRRDV